METVRLGGLYDGETTHQAGSVWDKNLIAPTIDTMQGGCREPMIIDSTIVAMRGRNPENPSDRTVGSPTEQRLEPNSQGICNTLTSVQKDNLVLENCIDLYNKNIRQDKCVGTLTTNSGTQFHCGSMGIVETISTKGKQIEVASTILAGYERTNMTGFNADNGVIEKVGQIEGSFEQSGRVYNSKGIAPTIMSNSHGNTTGGYTPHKIAVAEAFRIRKLTPLECWRLMDFTDEDFEKAAQVNSNTQLYKQAGNSIVKNVLVAILGQIIPGKEDVYKKLETR